MLSFASSLASQIGLLIAILNKSNYKSVVLELSKLTEYGIDASVLVLRMCLEQVNKREGEVQNLQLKLELLASVIKELVHQPNFATIFCEAVRQIVSISEDFLDYLSKALKLTIPEQIALGLALSNAEDLKHRQEGQSFCELKILELSQSSAAVTHGLILDIFFFLRQSEALSKHLPAFFKALVSIAPNAEFSLMLTPHFREEVNEVNCLRKFEKFSSSGLYTSDDMVQQLTNANHAAAVMEELGYSCTSDVECFKEILALFPSITAKDVARLVGMIARTHKGLDDAQGTHGTFSTALCSTEHLLPDYVSTWNVDVLLDALNQLVPDLNWISVIENLDYEGFFLPDQKAFSLLMTIYSKACQEPFPIEAVCGTLWKNGDGQMSFLRYAVAAPPDVFTFAHSPRKQAPIEGIPGQRSSNVTPNHAWLSLDLLEVLCRLGEAGQYSSVRSLLEFPLKNCPELLLLGMAKVKTDWNTLQSEIFSALLPAVFNSAAHTAVLQQLRFVNGEIVTRGMVEMHSKDPTHLSRFLDICQELKTLPVVLETTPFSFAIDLAALASRRECLNLEQWLQENITFHRDVFFQACLKFLRERRLVEARNEGQNGGTVDGQRSGPAITLSLETTALIFKVLQANIGRLSSRDLAEELKRVYNSAIRINPRLLSVGASEQSPSEVFAADIEEEANSYFQKIYVGQLTIEDVVGMLERFNESRVQREQEIFACMIQSLFDEYRFFPRYPERELKITAVLFGSLIKHQLVSSLTLGIALRCVLDALRKPLDTKMFSFGLTALEQFMDRLVEWPQYCNHILQISHMRDAHSDLMEFIERALARVSSSQSEVIGNVSLAEQTQVSSGPVYNTSNASAPEPLEVATGSALTTNSDVGERKFVGPSPSQSRFSVEGSEGMVLTSAGPIQHRELAQQQAPQAAQLALQQFQQQQQALEDRHKSTGASLNFGGKGPQLAPSQTTTSLFDTKSSQSIQSSSYQTSGNGQLATVASNFQRSSRSGLSSGLRQPSIAAGFGHAINIETLVAAAERRDIQIEAPNLEVQDKVAFVINNISTANLEPKAKEFLEAVKDLFYPWFAQYMVMKRASIEPNFHDLYLKFLDKISSKNLHKEIVKATYENCKVLLRSELIKSSSEERSLLKNLGSWLGKLTIGRNQTLRAKEIDPKSLITEAYEKGLMIAVIPFTSKILEPCQSSLAYQPPNPWTMGILGLLAEIYALPNLKMNLKFDIEVLYKNLGVDMKDVKPTQLLKGRPREIEGNPDFSNKDYATLHPQPPITISEPQSSLPSNTPALAQQLAPSAHLSSTPVQQEEEKVVSLQVSERSVSGQALSPGTPSPSPYSVGQVSMSIPNLTAYVVINPKLAGLGQQLHLSRIVPVAMERAIREIISPVVDRSVTIACMTTRELVIKDYAMEADENRTHQSANLMVASLSGSLAHVTCKEPLRVAMANHLRSLFQAHVGGDVLEQAVQLVTNDNLDLGCAVIEKAATEKALRDLEEAIGPSLALRRKQREALGATYYDASTYSQGNLARLPEALRPKPGRLSNSQQRVYEDFARLPWQNQPSQGTVAPVGSAAPPGISTLGPGSSRGPYIVTSAQGSGSSFIGSGATPTSGLGALAQPSELSSDELEHHANSPMSFTPAGSVIATDGASRPSQDGTGGLAVYPPVGSPTIEGSGLEAAAKIVGPAIAPSASPPLPTESLNSSVVEPSVTTGEAIEKYQVVVQKLDAAVSKVATASYSSLPSDHEIQSLVVEIPEIITQCISRDEAALAIAQKVFKRLYENTASHLHVSVHLAILEAIRDVCKRVVKELTSWVIYSDEDRKFNREITVGLIRSELIYLTDYNLHLAKLIDGGRNNAALEFSMYLVKTCVVEDGGVSNNEFQNVIDVLGKLAARPGSPEALQQLVEVAKNTTSAVSQSGAANKEDKSRVSKEKKLPSSRLVGLREDSKMTSRDMAAADPAGLRSQVVLLFEEWARICDAPGANDKAYAVYMSQLQHSGMLKGDDVSDRFFRILMELAVSHCLSAESQSSQGATGPSGQSGQAVSFGAIDMYAKLVVLLVKYYAVDPAMSKVALLNKVLNVTVRVIQRDADEKKTTFHPRPYFRLFVTWLMDFNSADPALESSNYQVLTAFGNALLALQPLRVPGWSFAWLELISHRIFMPKLLLQNQKGWPLFQRLLVALFKFMEPYLRNADLSDPVRLLYKGTLRVLLVLLHDFPEFLCDYHFSFCDVIPPSCIQMRNLILSAFPRNMRLPDPFTPNLKVDLLPEISQAPRILSDVEAALKNKQLKAEIDDYLKTRQPHSLLSVDLKQRLMLPQHEALPCGTRYNVPLINALVLYVGMQAIQQLQSKTTPQQLAVPTAPITHSAPMDIFQMLIVELDTEGRYLFLNAVANQLRYPNNHTHYFSCVLLYLFAEANQEIIQEQITRVLLERLIVNRPHPWGLLITFIELIKNPRYNFWSHGFTRCAPEIEKLFESVARSCMGPPLKPSEDDLSSGGLSSDGIKV
ncbi:CCR4-NOT transcription complex subunit 1 [Marchantia polymorpha subsp. ruderalis]|uniref:CCR4-NOT transcription complex subunit 1-like n=2 Tax=Marchantia polymorpha TaxID=3197 RepID=A0A176WFJ4_MARPO|nr:hypothetical protein AXG93_4421s1330 [Marchantia polymorpha subsp. ruderalis]PTQ40822.1 hypothetical protein MARPO_0037s0011 [Marchantia polymorpha]BBN05282.1 hypothetical protein Mp_3g11860 [Marchantia polymorpha subsp. ruderalis]|eukprot:PTQ40822.1 hypothetical protein MARPO_0037s0011 [Marchantia polymorpha]